MIHSPTPTRSEVSDVATAIYDGADAIMLSAESAAGAWPAEAVAMMNSIAVSVESDPEHYRRVHFLETEPEATTADALRSEEHTSELQSLMRISYAVFCLKKNTKTKTHTD